jgi:hypothetical protein
MGYGKLKGAIKTGMGGSSCGKGRSEYTETMKNYGKKLMRKSAKLQILEQELEYEDTNNDD